jgi:hypothetical protein
LVVVEKKVVEAFHFSLILKSNYFFVQLIQKKAAVLDNSSVISCFEGK